jgi:hypothetical protein
MASLADHGHGHDHTDPVTEHDHHDSGHDHGGGHDETFNIEVREATSESKNRRTARETDGFHAFYYNIATNVTLHNKLCWPLSSPGLMMDMTDSLMFFHIYYSN